MKDCYDLYEHWYCKNEIGPGDGFFEFYTLLEELVPDRHREEVFESFLALASRLEFEGFLMFCGMFFSAFIYCLDDKTDLGSDCLRG